MKNKTNNKRIKEKAKLVAETFFEIITMIVSIFAFAFIIGGMTIGVTEKVEAAEVSASAALTSFKGCCLEGNDGSICQDMNSYDFGSCKTNLLLTNCDTIETCQKGCCYDSNQGLCSLNSPKEKCLSNSGNWSNSATCDIQQCQLGCCIIGEQAAIITTRECTLLSDQYNLEKNFQSLDPDGSCNTKTGLSETGACTTPASDFSDENDCSFTTKEACTGTFYKDYLCTAETLNTNCIPSTDTTCIKDKDQIYFKDSCGNIANIYDASKINDMTYWTTVIEPAQSCSPANADCGNCDYLAGSVCYAYRVGQDTKPTYGDNVCRDLSCANGKQHGESWCITDYANTETPAVAPVGNRWFRGTCLNGEINVEPCADFNQEICIQGEGGTGFTEAKCTINDWRSCEVANDKESPSEVIAECKKYDQCTLFLDIPGNEKYSSLPGFDTSLFNSEQGAVGDIGKDANVAVVWCVPKYTPGLVFWSTDSSTGIQENSGLDYGGSIEESNAICGLGSFTCISHKQKKPALTGSWTDKENPECNIDAVSEENRAQVPLFMEAMNERCRSLGPCGMYVNIAGELGSDSNVSVSRLKIDSKGKESTQPSDGYELGLAYLGSLTEKSGLIKAGSLTSLTVALFGGLINVITGKEVVPLTPDMFLFVRLQTPTAVPTAPTASAGPGFLSGAGTVLSGAAIGATAGYFLGKFIAKQAHMSPGQSEAFIGIMTGAGAAVGVAVTAGLSTDVTLIGTLAQIGWIGLFAWFIIVVAILYAIYSVFQGEDNEYAITQYTCGVWTPPEQGDCSLCNNDIRTCSEYRCRSLGLNCQYYNDNGEPGWCAATEDTWSATISPWPEALTSGLSYTEISGTGFKIEGNETEKVPAWSSLQFGIITDKQAVCKIDKVHTQSYDEMSTQMIIDSSVGCESGSCANQGTYHKIGLSQYINGSESSSSTLSLVTGDNEFYIRCKNFAGQTNEAEFAVKIIVDDGPDITAPIINSFVPASESYVKLGQNSSDLVLYVSEPADCKYSQGSSVNYREMTQNLTCLTSSSMSILGTWPCYTQLKNLVAGENKFYFACEDKPDVEERASSTRIISEVNKEYVLKVCETGLNITKLSPENSIITGKSPIELTLEAETSGCIENGKSVCYYQFDSGGEIAFLNTNANKHSQTFTNLPTGDHNVTIKCVDDAGNSDQKNIQISISLDNTAPVVTRSYTDNNNLVITTTENSQCRFVQNSSIGCSFIYDNNDSSLMIGTGTTHTTTWEAQKNYYIKCKDNFGNQNYDCGIIVKTY